MICYIYNAKYCWKIPTGWVSCGRTTQWPLSDPPGPSIFLGRSRFYRSKVLLSEKSVDGAQLYKYVSSSRDRCIRFPCVSCCSTIARKRRVYGSWNCQKLGQRKESSTAAKTEARICQIWFRTSRSWPYGQGILDGVSIYMWWSKDLGSCIANKTGLNMHFDKISPSFLSLDHVSVEHFRDIFNFMVIVIT